MQRDEYGRLQPEQQEQERRGIGSAAISGAGSSPWQQEYRGSEGRCARMMSSGTAVGTTLGALAGAGIGAALMYLLDPDQGRRRREHLAHAAESALERTGGAIGHAWESGKEKAIEGAAAVYAATPSRKELRRAGRRLYDRTSSAAGEAAESTRETAGDWLESARSYLPYSRSYRSSSRRHHEHDVSASTAGFGAAGALLLGMGAMWLFDPDRGRARRAWIGQKTTHFLNETGGFMRATGKHLANKSKGYYHETRKAVAGAGHKVSDSNLAERVRSSLGRLGLRSGSSVGVECASGCVTLTGGCVPEEVDIIVGTTRGMPGVDSVVNRMEVGDRFQSPTSSAPTSI